MGSSSTPEITSIPKISAFHPAASIPVGTAGTKKVVSGPGGKSKWAVKK